MVLRGWQGVPGAGGVGQSARVGHRLVKGTGRMGWGVTFTTFMPGLKLKPRFVFNQMGRAPAFNVKSEPLRC